MKCSIAKNPKAFILLCVMIFVTQSTLAHIQSYSRQYIFHRLSTTDGLSNNNVSCILKDKEGYLWIGTEYGLNRYDGHTFEKYYFTGEFTGNISQLLEDGLGNLWVRAGQYMIYNRSDDKFDKASDVLKCIGVNCRSIDNVFIDKVGELWLISDKKIIHIDKKRNTKIYNISVAGEIISLVRHDSVIYFSASAKIYEFNLNTEVYREIKTILTDANNPTLYLFSDENNDLWMYSTESDVLLRKRYYSDLFEQVSLAVVHDRYVIREILDDKCGNIWIATDNSGVFIINKNTGNVINECSRPFDMTSIANNNVNHLYIDSDSVIWLGHYKGGISYHSGTPGRISGTYLDVESSVVSLLEDKDGCIWLATDGHGLLKKRDNSSFQRVAIPSRTIISIHKDADDGLWIGTYMDGLYYYDRNGKITHYTTKNSKLPNNNIWDIQEDDNHNIWLGTLQNGLCLFNPKTKSFSRLLKDPQVNCVFRLHYAGKDTLYVATDIGLGIVNTKTMQSMVLKGNMSGTKHFQNDFVRTVYNDSHNRVWLGYAGGIAVWDRRSDNIIFISEKDGLCNNLINDIIEDDNHNIWVSTGDGLSNIIISPNPKDDNDFIKQIINYSHHDGLSCNDLNRFTKLHDGRIALTAERGYNYISTYVESKSGKKYIPRITNVVINNQTAPNTITKHFPERDEITIPASFFPKENYLRIYFSSFNFNNSGKLKYAYQINDDKKEWQPISDNYIALGPLSFGEYTIRIKSCDENGIWNDEYSEIKVYIKPPFWMTKIAIVLYFILLCAGLYYIRYVIRKKLRNKLEIQKKEQEARKKSEMYDLKMDFLTNISHDIRTPLSLIISPLERLAEDVKGNSSATKKVDIAYKNAQYLLDLVNQLLDLRRIDVKAEKLNLVSGNINNFLHEICENFRGYAEKNRRNLTYEASIGDLRIMFDKEKINRIMYNLLSNAFKFTSIDGNIAVEVSHDEEWLYIRVIDDGIGIAEENIEQIFKPFFQIKQKDVNHGAGIGLHITSEYLKLCGGDIHVENNEPHGCKFICKLPLLYPAKDAGNKSVVNDAQENSQLIQSSRHAHPTILLVEDNIEFREFISQCLSEKYNVLTAEDGLSALGILRKEEIDIVISDVMMPNIDGNKLCEIIKTTLEWSHIPVILLTARTSDEHKVTGFSNGADDYITKPVNLKLLNLRIEKFLDWKARCHREFNKEDTIQPEEVTISSIDEQFVVLVHEIIERNLSNPAYSIDSFCTDLNVSRANLYRKFMAIIGQSPVEYMRLYRLKKARKMLQKGCSISEIAYNTGFTHPKYFTKYFKEQYGVTPSQYIKQL